MQLVIDSNEYIIAFVDKNSYSRLLINKLFEQSERYLVRIPRLVVNEVRNNLSLETFKEFVLFISEFTTVDEDFVVPYEVGDKYESMGFKHADAFIAAYTEWTGAEFLVTENRHFLTIHKDLPFKIKTAERTLEILRNHSQSTI